MHTDKNTETAPGDEAPQATDIAKEDTDDSTLSWLLDMDMSEPEEKLFTVDSSEQALPELSGYELDVASRPMMRGSTDADDLENYIGEEIVISSEGQSSDIYTDSAPGAALAKDDGNAHRPETMAIDFSRPDQQSSNGVEVPVAEGSDILGLDDNDDMGEKFLVVRRVQASGPVVAPAEKLNGAQADVSNSAEVSDADAAVKAVAGVADSGNAQEQTVSSGLSLESEAELESRLRREKASEAKSDTNLEADVELDSGLGLQLEADEDDAAEIEVDGIDDADLCVDMDLESGLNIGSDQDLGSDLDLESYTGAETESELEAMVALDSDMETLLEQGVEIDEEVELPEAEQPEGVIESEAVEAPESDGWLQPVDFLNAAPSLSQVDEAAAVPVANDDPGEGLDLDKVDISLGSLEEMAAAAGPSSPENVRDYVNSVPAPSDEEAFDEYLVRGEELSEEEADLDELALEDSEEAAFFDVSPEEGIDYHEDFQRLAGFSGAALSNVAPLVPQLMQELVAAISERLQGFGLESDSVQPELMLESDPVKSERLLADNYASALEIFVNAPTALQQLGQQDIDSIYLRLVHQDSGAYWNDLLHESFEIPSVQLPREADSTIEKVSEMLTLVPRQEAPAFDVFGDDLGAGDSLEDILADDWQPDAEDIDDIFADLGAEVAASEDEYAALDEPDVASDQIAALPETPEVFAENIFSEEISTELESAAAPLATDIDAAFDDIALEPRDGDDICGLDVDEFSGEMEQEQDQDSQPEAEQTAPLELEPEPEAALEQPATEQAAEQAAEAAASADAATAVAYEYTAIDEISWFIPAGVLFAECSPGGGEIFPDFLDAFIEEGSSELEKLEDAVGAWENDCNSDSAFAVVNRVLHTVKGIAKGVGLHYYGTLIHNFETLLGALQRPANGAEAEYFRIVNAWLDAAVRGLDHIRDNRSDIRHVLPRIGGESDEAVAETFEPEAAQDQLDSEKESKQATIAEVEAPKASTVKEKQSAKKLADEGARALAAQQTVRITSEKLDHLLNLANQAQQLGVRTSQGTARSKRAAAEMLGRLSSVRAHIASIADRAHRNVSSGAGAQGAGMDALEMDQYSELQEAANILREGVEDLADLVEFASRQNVQVEALLKQQSNVIASIGSAIRAARVVPVSRLVPGLRRLVRTVSVDLDKKVSLQVLNELGTLDRDDYARCQTILDHMMRNALDHGIESAQERSAAGKPATGLVSIDIRKAGADAIITLSDDGRGIDPEAMRKSALRKGLEIDVDALSDEEAVRLVFHKGFSTADTVSQISGRGVGMDIVLSELQEMGGDIQIESEVGRGTSFHIRVPSSITVNGALLVRAGEHSYAIPLAGLVAVEQVPVETFFNAVESGGRLTVSGMDCEPAYLGTLCQTGEFPDAKSWRDSVPVIIAGSPERYMAIAIDDLEEALEMVIRSLGTQFNTVPGVAGAATTAAGEAIVALDLNMLVASVGVEDHSTLRVREGNDEALLVMVVDDSRTQRMVATSQLETVGVETVTAENGGVAIDLLNTADRLPDIILLDVEMPVKDGIQTLREIRKSLRYSHIPVIMVTSRTGLKHRALAEAAGCNGYMGKPFNFRMLVGQINELTGHRLHLN